MVCGPSSPLLNFLGLQRISKWIPFVEQGFFLHHITF